MSFDTIINCDGSRETLKKIFPRDQIKQGLAIGLTVNFKNHRSEEEIRIEEIPGVTRNFRLDWFNVLKRDFDIDLENIVYYKDETHYFVMTISKNSLLRRGVLKNDFSSDQSHRLLHDDNSKI